MPGVLNSNSHFGFSREVGKMASFIDPTLLSMEYDDAGLEDIANRLLLGGESTTIADLMDSDTELPDNETPMDLLKYLETSDSGLEFDHITCAGDCNDHSGSEAAPVDKYNKYRVSPRTDPFMGMGGQESTSPTTKNSLLSQMMSPLDYDFDQYTQQQKQQTQSFEAWGHRTLPIKKEEEDDDDYCDDIGELTKSSISHLVSSTYIEDEEVDSTLPISFLDTPSPSSQSGTATGDDSDVDIETITEIPRAADSCGYVTQDSLPPSRAGSPVSGLRSLHSGSLMSILAKSSAGGASPASPPSSACSSAASSPRPSPTVHFNTYGVSSSASLAENLMKGRTSLLGQKRKMAREKRAQQQHHHHHHNHHQLEHRVSSSSSGPAFTHVLCTSNSINFHDYAMSPLSPEISVSNPFASSSTDTGLPTVSHTKRVYKRKQLALDATDKEKQHHHNQLERNRRQKLADLFIDLRDEVPKIACQSKASKVMILNEATEYIHELRRLDEIQEKDISTELRRKEALSRQLRHIKSQLGVGRVG